MWRALCPPSVPLSTGTGLPPRLGCCEPCFRGPGCRRQVLALTSGLHSEVEVLVVCLQCFHVFPRVPEPGFTAVLPLVAASPAPGSPLRHHWHLTPRVRAAPGGTRPPMTQMGAAPSRTLTYLLLFPSLNKFCTLKKNNAGTWQSARVIAGDLGKEATRSKLPLVLNSNGSF